MKNLTSHAIRYSLFTQPLNVYVRIFEKLGYTTVETGLLCLEFYNSAFNELLHSGLDELVKTMTEEGIEIQ